MPPSPPPLRPSRPFRYRVFGLAVESEIALPDLTEAAEAGAADVTVRIGTIAARPGEPGIGYGVDERGAVLVVPQVGRFLIPHGREILVEPAPGASPRNVRLYLLGSALGAVLHQRGLLPLHANAIEVDGRAVAFLGPSGIGKSTLAAWFGDRGHRVLCDDVCVVTGILSGAPRVQPGLARLRLKADALERSGRSAADYDPSFDDYDKYDVPIPRDGAEGDRPLAALYLVTDRPAAEPLDVSAMSGVAALEALVANTYRGGLIGMLGRTGDHLAQCAALSRTTPVFKVARPRDPARIDEQNTALLRHASLAGERPARARSSR